MYRTDEITDYVFNNTQPLSHNISFVKKHLVGGKNQAIDEPESVLDAMAQASECPQIGWDRSDDVMRLMIVITETGSKRSRHGDIIGIINPNDGECKMDDLSLLETMDTDYIHPHILGESLSRNAIRVLILTRQNKIKHYEVLTESFRHQVMGIKDFNKITGTSLISIIENSVQQARTIKFNIEFMMSELQVQHTLTCPSSKNAVTNALECPTVDIDQIAKLSLTINYNKRVCLAHNVNKHNATMNTYVKVNGFYHFSINATFQCMCSCSNAQMTDESQRACSGNGTLVCGKCKCDTGLEGDTCQCQKGKQPALDDEPECKKDIDCGENALHGKCVCGKCVCLSPFNQFYGPGCNCSDLICPFTQRGYCNSRGSCVCGKCICDENYIGNDCSVLSCDNSLKEDECKRTTELPVCSGNGVCDCGKCTCEPGYVGKYCESIKAPEVRCSHTWDCMTYIMASKKKEGCNISVKFVEKIDELSSLYSPICLAIINGCTTTFMININKQGSGVDRITVKKVNIKKDCHRRVNFNKILLIVIGITAAATFTIFVTSCVIYHNFIKSRADEQSEVLRQRRIKFLMQGSFINNTSGRYELPPEILPSTSNRESKLESINE